MPVMSNALGPRTVHTALKEQVAVYSNMLPCRHSGDSAAKWVREPQEEDEADLAH